MYCFLFNSSENQLIYYIYSIDSGYYTLIILVSVWQVHRVLQASIYTCDALCSRH